MAPLVLGRRRQLSSAPNLTAARPGAQSFLASGGLEPSDLQGSREERLGALPLSYNAVESSNLLVAAKQRQGAEVALARPAQSRRRSKGSRLAGVGRIVFANQCVVNTAVDEALLKL